MPRDLIVFGEDWGGLPSSTQHLVSHLAASRKVLWVNSIGLRRPRLGWQDARRGWAKITRSIQNKAPMQPTAQALFPVVNPLTLPAPQSHLERRIAARMLVSSIQPALVRHGLKNPIFWTSLPTAVDVAGQLGDSGLVYYCGDDFGSLAGVDHATVTQRESELVQRADLVMTASQTLALKHAGRNTQLLSHGVDTALFSTPVPRAADLPNDGRPIAGFYGSISEWLDIDLLAQTIARCPDWHFVFIGKAVVNIDRLRCFDNVHFLGERPHAALPSYSQHWDASLLPFANNAQIRACNPLKLREYLATGRPVVSTDFPALDDYRDFVHCVDSVTRLVTTLRHCASLARNPSQIEAVAGYDWSVQADKVATWLDRL